MTLPSLSCLSLSESADPTGAPGRRSRRRGRNNAESDAEALARAAKAVLENQEILLLIISFVAKGDMTNACNAAIGLVNHLSKSISDQRGQIPDAVWSVLIAEVFERHLTPPQRTANSAMPPGFTAKDWFYVLCQRHTELQKAKAKVQELKGHLAALQKLERDMQEELHKKRTEESIIRQNNPRLSARLNKEIENLDFQLYGLFIDRQAIEWEVKQAEGRVETLERTFLNPRAPRPL